MRTLRTYEHVAQMEHTCNICGRLIRAGDIYQGTVSINRAERISVYKEHIHPFCPEEFFDEEEEIMRSGQRDAEREKASRVSFPEARPAAA